MSTTVRLSVRRSAAIQTFDKKELPQVYVKAMHTTGRISNQPGTLTCTVCTSKHVHSVRHGPKSEGRFAPFGGANIPNFCNSFNIFCCFIFN